MHTSKPTLLAVHHPLAPVQHVLYSIRLVMQDNQTTELLQAMCSKDKAVFRQYAAKQQLNSHCHLAGTY